MGDYDEEEAIAYARAVEKAKEAVERHREAIVEAELWLATLQGSVVNAERAVALAEAWQRIPTMREWSFCGN